MTKNVIVVDELGNEYAPTYAKRARGLVKQGRARWRDENTICLACPPNDLNLEDNEMENMDKIDVMENMEVVAAEVQPEETITYADILARIDGIIAQNEEMAKAVQAIRELSENDSKSGLSRADAIRQIYDEREKTNRKMLDILDRMLPEKKDDSTLLEKVLKLDFTGVLPDTAKIMLDFVERHI